MLDNHPCIVFAQEHFNPLGIIRSLGEKGINPIYIAIKRKADIGILSKYISKRYRVNTVDEGYQILLREYGDFDKDSLPLVFCSDDRTMGYLDAHYSQLKDRFIFFNAGEDNRINRFINKSEILRLAKECGLSTLPTITCKNGEIPDSIDFPIITKSISPNVGGWKADVHICNNINELKSAYNSISAETVILQKYIEKKNELEFYGISINHGNDVLISIGLNYVYNIKGYYSPYMNIFMPSHPDIQDGIKTMLKTIGYEGMFDAEFIVDNDDQVYLLEINLRSPAWAYASTSAGVNLPYLWAYGMIHGKIPDDAYVEFEPFRAMAEPIDFAKRVDSGLITIAEWLKDFKSAQCTYYYNPDDIKPFETLYNNWESLK